MVDERQVLKTYLDMIIDGIHAYMFHFKYLVSYIYLWPVVHFL